MVRVSLFFRHAQDGGFDDFRGRDQLLPLVRRLLGPEGLRRVQLDRGVAAGSPDEPPAFSAILHLEFASLDEFQRAIADHGEAISEELARCSQIDPFVQVSEIVADEDVTPAT